MGGRHAGVGVGAELNKPWSAHVHMVAAHPCCSPRVSSPWPLDEGWEACPDKHAHLHHLGP